MLSDQLRVIDIDRTRMRLLFRDADLGQKIDQHLGFDFEFASQFVNSNLICFRHFLLTETFLQVWCRERRRSGY
jgi:hypothetical protein